MLPGNNSQLVRRVLLESRRSDWEELASSTGSHFHFRWAPVSKQINFDRLSFNFFSQCANHVEGHGELSRKHELFRNLRSYCVTTGEDVFAMTPLTFYVKVTPENVKQQLKPFRQAFESMERGKVASSHFEGKNMWILKPTSLNRGQGIHVAASYKRVKRLIRDYCRGREIPDSTQ